MRNASPTNRNEHAASNLRVSDPDLVPALAEYLRARDGYVVAEHDDGTIDVSALGSHQNGGRPDIELYLRAWEAAHQVTVETVAG